MYELDNEKLLKRIKEERKRLEIDQVDLAGLVGLSRTHLNRIENGARPISANSALSLCLALGIDLNTVVSFQGKLKPIKREMKLLICPKCRTKFPLELVRMNRQLYQCEKCKTVIEGSVRLAQTTVEDFNKATK